MAGLCSPDELKPSLLSGRPTLQLPLHRAKCSAPMKSSAAVRMAAARRPAGSHGSVGAGPPEPASLPPRPSPAARQVRSSWRHGGALSRRVSALPRVAPREPAPALRVAESELKHSATDPGCRAAATAAGGHRQSIHTSGASFSKCSSNVRPNSDVFDSPPSKSVRTTQLSKHFRKLIHIQSFNVTAFE